MNPIADKSFEFAVRIYSLAKQVKNHGKEYDLSRQPLRASTSIGANIAEAVKAQSKADFVSKMAIALKEANETHYWLRLLYRIGLISADEHNSFCKEVNELISMLNAIGKTANPVRSTSC